MRRLPRGPRSSVHPPARNRRAKVGRAAIAVALVSLIATACHRTAPTGGGGAPLTTAGPVTPAVPSAAVRISPPDGSSEVDPANGVSVSVSGGRVVDVSVHSPRGDDPGAADATATSWHTTWALATSAHYTVTVTAIDQAGRTVHASSAFDTLTPARTFRTTIFEGYHKTYGVGMPIVLTFSEPITNREAVERALELHTSKSVVGAWYWDGSKTLDFRPRGYWPAHTSVDFTGHLDGVEGAPGVYGVHTLTQSFEIGRSLIAVASTARHHVKVYLDKKLFGDWPMSSGKPGDDTPNGTYLTIAKTNPEHMVGPGYDLEVPWSVRFTWSGDFLHDAYWSVGQQGFENVSHGCINLSPANAKTYYGLAVPGDPVTVSGSPRAGVWGNGWTEWFLSWKSLLAGTATHQAVRAGPDGSSFVDPSTLSQPSAKPPLGAPEPGNAEAA